MCTFLYGMENCGIWNRCILGLWNWSIADRCGCARWLWNSLPGSSLGHWRSQWLPRHTQPLKSKKSDTSMEGYWAKSKVLIQITACLIWRDLLVQVNWWDKGPRSRINSTCQSHWWWWPCNPSQHLSGHVKWNAKIQVQGIVPAQDIDDTYCWVPTLIIHT